MEGFRQGNQEQEASQFGTGWVVRSTSMRVMGAPEFVGSNSSHHHLGISFGYLILDLYWEHTTTVLVIAEARTVPKSGGSLGDSGRWTPEPPASSAARQRRWRSILHSSLRYLRQVVQKSKQRMRVVSQTMATYVCICTCIYTYILYRPEQLLMELCRTSEVIGYYSCIRTLVSERLVAIQALQHKRTRTHRDLYWHGVS